MYTAARVITGLHMVFQSFLSTIDFNGFLNEVDVLFENVQIFNFKFLYYTAPLVPFEEFTLGILIALGLHTKVVLKISFVLFAYLTLFLFDAGVYSEAICHIGVVVLVTMLFVYKRYNSKSMDHEIRSHSLL